MRIPDGDNPNAVQDDPNPPGGLKQSDVQDPEGPLEDNTRGSKGTTHAGKTGVEDLRDGGPGTIKGEGSVADATSEAP